MKCRTSVLPRVPLDELRWGRNWLLLFVTLTAFAGQQLSGQATSSGPGSNGIELAYSANDLEFYLLQALTTDSASKRIKLNHIGLQLKQIGEDYYVSSALDGYPAHLAGLQRSDKITEVDNQPYHPIWSFNKGDGAEQTAFKPDPKQYTIAYQRGGEVHTVTVVPVFENLYDSYRSATASSLMHFASGNKTIGYVHFWTLSRATNDVISYNDLFQQLRNTDGLILDLRNSYGYLSAEHLDAIFPSRRSYYQLSDGAGNITQSFQSNRLNHDYYGKPIVVLQDNGTTGDMELLAHQIAKLQRGVSFGESTAGRLGNFELTRQRSLQYIPAATGYVDGQPFEGFGTSPDNPVDFPISEPQISDPQFEAAMGELLGIM